MTALDIAEIIFIVLVAGVGLGLIINVLKDENETSQLILNIWHDISWVKNLHTYSFAEF
ncbi:hypothetical protein [Campylobacter concisus]|uniref:hypothetical protein n=1 Tax=Campylobacter concisus TaxID=199 RepID=UPI0015E1A771|nr:hypothetical protein [Campylobacter concisus]